MDVALLQKESNVSSVDLEAIKTNTSPCYNVNVALVEFVLHICTCL